MDVIRECATGLQHIGLPTSDIEATVAFYKGLGFTVALRTTNEVTGEAVVFLQLKSVMIETYQTASAAGKAGAIDHLAIDVTDVNAVFADVRDGGYVLLENEVQQLPFWKQDVRFFTILGPNGEKIEFSQKL